MKQYKSWQKTKHATVFAQLQGDEVKKADCIKCHTTGYGQPGGFTSVELTPNLENVQCEACHGQGSAHIEAAKSAPESGDWDKKINKVPQNVCVDCHNPHINRKEMAEKSRAEQRKVTVPNRAVEVSKSWPPCRLNGCPKPSTAGRPRWCTTSYHRSGRAWNLIVIAPIADIATG